MAKTNSGKALTSVTIKPERLFFNDCSSVYKDIEGLKNSITTFGLRQPLSVKKMTDGRYKIIGGQRRFAAISMLLEEGKDIYRNGIPCVVGSYNLESELDEEIMILEENIHNRNGLNHESLERLYFLYQEKKKDDKRKGLEPTIPEAVTLHIAQKLGVTQRETQKYTSIYKHAEPWLKDAVCNGDISVDSASSLVKNTELREKAKTIYENGGSLTRTVLKKLKNPSDPSIMELPLKDFLKRLSSSSAMDSEEYEIIENLFAACGKALNKYYESCGMKKNWASKRDALLR